MAEDPKTRSLLLCVMDGHGEDGDKVAQALKGKFANYLFSHKAFATDIKAALVEVIAKMEGEVLRGVLLLSLIHPLQICILRPIFLEQPSLVQSLEEIVVFVLILETQELLWDTEMNQEELQLFP